MYPVKLTNDDYKVIAHNRARRFVDKKQRSNKKMMLTEWFGTLGLILAVIPVVISQVKNTTGGDAELIMLAILLALLFVFSWVRIPAHRKIEKDILQKWGIKEKKGKRWASE